MKQTVSLGARFGWLGAHATYVHAALLAAHVAAPRGFRPSEVRFYFLLFTNWMEADVMRPGQDLDLTQVRRAIARLCRLGHAGHVRRAGVAEGKRPSFRLTREGMLALAAAVVEPPGHRPFEEMLFSIAFAAAYADLLAARLRAARHPGATSPLDARSAVKTAQRGLAALSRDLDERVRSSLAMEATSRRGSPDELDMTSLFAEHGGYQLERVKPLKELLAGLPPDVRSFERARGIRLRRELLFAPMAQAIRAQQAVLEEVALLLGSTRRARDP